MLQFHFLNISVNKVPLLVRSPEQIIILIFISLIFFFRFRSQFSQPVSMIFFFSLFVTFSRQPRSQGLFPVESVPQGQYHVSPAQQI